MNLLEVSQNLKIQGILAAGANAGAFALTYAEQINVYLKTASLLLGVVVGILTIRKFIKEWNK